MPGLHMGLTKLHYLLLKLLKVPFSVYDNLQDGWRNFEFIKETG